MSSEIIQENNIQNVAESTESAKLILKNVTKLSELSSQFINETKVCEKYLDTLNKLIFQAGKDVSSLQNCVNSLLLVAKKVVYVSLKMVPMSDPIFNNFKAEAEKLLNVLDEITENEEVLDEKLKSAFSRSHLNLTKCLNINEKYPERCSRESLLDISNVVNLPTVPEDAFADFCRPNRTKSACSLKNMLRVKMCLQKMSNDNTDQTSAKSDLAGSNASMCSETVVEDQLLPLH